MITLEGSWNSGGVDAAPTGGYIYKLNGQPRLSYVEASGISKDTVLTTTAQNVHNLTVKLSGDSVVIDPSSTNTLAYIVWKFNGGSGASSVPSWVNLPLTDTADFDTSCEYRISFPAYGSGSTAKPAVKQYAWAIYAGKIEFGDTGTNDYPLYIPKNDKANFYHPSYGKVTSWGVAPEKIEKRCN